MRDRRGRSPVWLTLAPGLAAALCLLQPYSAPLAAQPLRPVSKKTAVALPAVDPMQALMDYRAAIALLPRPPNAEFQYTQTRSGPKRIITEQHRVYLNGSGQERDETTAVNGAPVIPAIVRIFRRRVWPYWASQFLIRGDVYNATFRRVIPYAGRSVYAFDVKRALPANFSITTLYLDSRRFLPLREAFDVSGGGCAGGGAITFAAAGYYWLPSAIDAACVSNQPSTSDQRPGLQTPQRFRQSIRFFGWQFPKSIPDQVFGSVGTTALPRAGPPP